MHTINVNGILNYQRYKRREISRLIKEMPNEQKQHALESIQLQQGINNLTGQQYDTTTLLYIEKLLTGGSNERRRQTPSPS